MLRRVILFILLFCFTLNLSDSTPAISQDNIPYIQYFSQDLKAFVIERADGTDRQVIGAGLMPEEDDFVDGPGWSPSGEWFAWSSRQMADEMTMPTHAYIVRVDGLAQVTAINDLAQVGEMVWSPVEDLIAVTNYADLEYISGPSSTTVYQIDVAQNRIVQSFEAEGVAFPVWSPDGRFLLITTNQFSDRFYTISRTGQVRTFEKAQVDLPAWHSDGRLMLWDVIENDLLLMDLETAKTERYVLGTPPLVRQSLTPYTEISPRWVVDTLTYASVLSADGCSWLFSTYSEEFRVYKVWLLDLANEEVIFLTETEHTYPFREANLFLSPEGSLAFFERSTATYISIADHTLHAYWLRYPEIIVYQKGEEYWIYDIKIQRAELFGEQIEPFTTFSPDKRWLLYFLDDQFRIFDRQTGGSSLILGDAPFSFADGIRWLPDNSGVTFTIGSQTFSYHIASGILNERLEIRNAVSYSPDGRTEFYYGQCNGEIGSCLHDLETNTYTLVPTHPDLVSAAGGRIPYDFMEWHPDSEWLLLDQGRASGGRIPYITIVRRDGTEARPLTWGCFNPICLQWVD